MAKKKLFDEHGNEVKGKIKKPFYKKWWVWLIALVVIGSAFGGQEDETTDVAGVNESSVESEESIVTESKESAVEESIESEEVESVISTEKEVEIPEPSEVQFDPNDYDTELTYEDLARNPVENAYKAVTFEGTIVQVVKGDGLTQYRFAVNDDYDQMMMIEIDNSQLDSRILENDYIRIYGTYFGEITYESALGGNITIPGVVVEKFDFL